LTIFSTDNFITNADEPEEESSRRNHALLNRNFAADDKSPEEIANAIVGRHRDRPAPYTGDMSEIPQRLLMPSVHDASLWQIRVKVCLADFLFLFLIPLRNFRPVVNETLYLVSCEKLSMLNILPGRLASFPPSNVIPYKE